MKSTGYTGGRSADTAQTAANVTKMSRKQTRSLDKPTKNESGPMIFCPDLARRRVETTSGGRNTLLYDAAGMPSEMVIMESFDLAEIDPTWPKEPHPAFLNTRQVFIAKYLASMCGDQVVSVRNAWPATNISFDQASQACSAKGAGWRLLSNTEWAAVALWAWKHGTMPSGKLGQYGIASTGSGPESSNHDGTPFGISDLVGNVWQWVDDLVLQGGEVQVRHEGTWHAVSSGDGAFIPPGSIGSVRLNSDGGFPFSQMSNQLPDLPVLRQLGLYPIGTDLPGYFYASVKGERLPFRGGYWDNGSLAGVFALHLYYARSHPYTFIGFRPAFSQSAI